MCGVSFANTMYNNEKKRKKHSQKENKKHIAKQTMDRNVEVTSFMDYSKEISLTTTFF